VCGIAELAWVAAPELRAVYSVVKALDPVSSHLRNRRRSSAGLLERRDRNGMIFDGVRRTRVDATLNYSYDNLYRLIADRSNTYGYAVNKLSACSRSLGSSGVL
jgi:hypothetical protein